MVLSKKLKRVYILESVKNKLAFLETGNKAFEAESQAVGRALLHASGRTCERLCAPALDVTAGGRHYWFGVFHVVPLRCTTHV